MLNGAVSIMLKVVTRYIRRIQATKRSLIYEAYTGAQHSKLPISLDLF